MLRQLDRNPHHVVKTLRLKIVFLDAIHDDTCKPLEPVLHGSMHGAKSECGNRLGKLWISGKGINSTAKFFISLIEGCKIISHCRNCIDQIACIACTSKLPHLEYEIGNSPSETPWSASADQFKKVANDFDKLPTRRFGQSIEVQLRQSSIC